MTLPCLGAERKTKSPATTSQPSACKALAAKFPELRAMMDWQYENMGGKKLI